jgi:hypothetical protein
LKIFNFRHFFCNTNKRKMARAVSRRTPHQACVSRTAKKLHKSASPAGHKTVLKRANKQCAKAMAAKPAKRTMKKRASPKRAAKRASPKRAASKRRSAKKM